MARYIDADKVEEIMRNHRCSDCTNEKSLDCPLCQLHRPFTEISNLPTADVVSKSEVAREIFEGIEELVLAKSFWGEYSVIFHIDEGEYERFKKKYTESEEDLEFSIRLKKPDFTNHDGSHDYD